MAVVMQICGVVVTLAVVAIAIAAMRAMHRFEVATDEFTKTAEAVRASIAQAEIVTREVQELFASVQSVVPPVQRAVTRVESLAERATRLSNVVLDEVEGPIRNTLALLTGVRIGAHSLVGAFTRRAGRQATNGGYDND